MTVHLFLKALLALFVLASARDNAVDRPLAWLAATFFAGVTDAFAFGSWVVVLLYVTARRSDPERSGRFRRWLIRRDGR